ncbi:unnamed protein product [Ilex paraguariensis]|uniref:Uncharacterized protein n=1 Tax=Ilex paraguariensis TaxID=185542 RepID=A0ABC8TWR3_9AQUA
MGMGVDIYVVVELRTFRVEDHIRVQLERENEELRGEADASRMSLKLLERQISEITSPVDSLESTVNASIETKVQAELQSWFAAFLQQMEESSQIPNILHSDR